MRTITVMFVLAGLAFAHGPEFDVPLPGPVAVFNVNECGCIRCPGEMLWHRQRLVSLPDNKVSSLIWEDGLAVKNIAAKTITRMVIEVAVKGIKGESFVTTHQLELTDPKYGPPEPVNPGESWKEPYHPKTYQGARMHETVRSLAEYRSLRAVTPNAKVHAISVTFSDGTKYEEPSLVSK